jgi:hypothetical protein
MTGKTILFKRRESFVLEVQQCEEELAVVRPVITHQYAVLSSGLRCFWKIFWDLGLA